MHAHPSTVPPRLRFPIPGPLRQARQCPPSLKIVQRLPLPFVAPDLSFPSPNCLAPAPDWTHTSPSKVSSKTGRNLSNTLTVHCRPRQITSLRQRPQNQRPHPRITIPTVQRHHHLYPDNTKPPTRPTDPLFHVRSRSLISTSWRLPPTCVLPSKRIKNVRSPSSNSAGNNLTPASAWVRLSPFPS